ncbi:hypothetical protein ARMSODRAFT_1027244 [Armillaria solidipes]|uniref:Uncharacterized protein n=1 Tax=Armillaria solidipes TaxID=1076256 RepID=A0A2H3B6Y9_9AGAR|nr:hypothetical protein ARMSODRAFT_1027244 [Armillaria solidipes]
MDTFYDKVKAAELIENLAKERQSQNPDACYLSEVNLNKEWQKQFDFIQRLSPAEWRLVFKSSNETVSETVLVLHGAVCRLDLPPVKARVSPKRAMYLRQGISITGYGSLTFGRAIEAVSSIYTLFSRDIGERNMANVECIGMHQGFQSLSSSNCYLTRRDQADDLAEVLIPPAMDPHRHLEEAAGEKYVYTDDNEIFCYERKIMDSGEREFVDISPSKIQIGDIVEVHMTFMAVPVKDGKKKVISTLRSITLLDGNLTEMVIAAKTNLRLQATTAPRKRGVHDGEMMIDTRCKFSCMKIHEGEEMDSTSLKV